MLSRSSLSCAIKQVTEEGQVGTEPCCECNDAVTAKVVAGHAVVGQVMTWAETAVIDRVPSD